MYKAWWMSIWHSASYGPRYCLVRYSSERVDGCLWCSMFDAVNRRIASALGEKSECAKKQRAAEQ